MDILWSASTTMRNPERTYSFLKTIAELEGKVWNNEMQMVLQSLLIKNRFYIPNFINLDDEDVLILRDLDYDMTYEEARKIFDKKKYTDPPMRGRTSFDPIEKLGLVMLDINKNKDKIIRITNLGRLFLNKEINLSDVVFSNLLKLQYPNPLTSDRRDYNTKPFINTLKLIKLVNEICVKRNDKTKGISKEEFGIFALSIKNYSDVKKIAEILLEFRNSKRKIHNINEDRVFTENFINKYLNNFKRPIENIKEYTDNIIRYLRLTKYIIFRGGGYYIDLEPRRMVEINTLLENDSGEALPLTLDEYKNYISDYYAYKLPFETKEHLKEIVHSIIFDINILKAELNEAKITIKIDDTIIGLKQQIIRLREKRTSLQNLVLKKEYQNIDRIDKVIYNLKNIRNLGLKPSIALEKWANIALNIINDAILIKPNSPLGDDNEPIFTAPAGVADIECYYDGFGVICEVTMLTNRSQWFNEGQPVMRHLREFEIANSKVDNYCLFIAPKLHIDTLNTFWISVKYEYQGEKQRIIPITLSQLCSLLKIIKKVKENNKKVKKEDILRLYNSCISINRLSDSLKWSEYINMQIDTWGKELLA